MEKRVFTCFRLLSVLLLNSASAQNTNVFFPEGGTLNLSLPVSEALSSVLWKHNGNLVVEMVNSDLEYYGRFENRTTLNQNTGRLEIKNITEADSGSYSVEINNKVQSQGYDVTVLKKVPKPEVVVRPLTCAPALERCSLSCEGDTRGDGTVTYSWKQGDGEWKQEERSITIANSEEIKGVKTFSCRMNNPVSEAESEPHQNPLFQDETLFSPGGLNLVKQKG
ncbi:SLAM family member 9-like isoform X2 [Xiphias gladius]|uniref:SLAM family member 9-like isoform X1 n=1 Tax=Xiphias gladius TaxID=8245 RepID=UPI001A9931DA|nr:SLAM family member 9-like isoform X1 [Xiphias gladius]XP_039994558.1 SLAM family member 9-like isoform X2 [Xiphias gladius]